jgi:hypothetical protein
MLLLETVLLLGVTTACSKGEAKVFDKAVLEQ